MGDSSPDDTEVTTGGAGFTGFAPFAGLDCGCSLKKNQAVAKMAARRMKIEGLMQVTKGPS